MPHLANAARRLDGDVGCMRDLVHIVCARRRQDWLQVLLEVLLCCFLLGQCKGEKRQAFSSIRSLSAIHCSSSEPHCLLRQLYHFVAASVPLDLRKHRVARVLHAKDLSAGRECVPCC